MAETELLELFEAARNAADAAEKDANPAEVDRCVDAIRRLRDVPVTVKVLVDTQVGKKLRSHLTKHSIKKIQKAASELCDLWKKKVIEETTKKKESNGSNKDLGNLEAKPERTETIKMQKPGTATGTGSRSNTAKIEENESNGRVKVEKISKSESFKIEKTKMEQRSSVNGTFTKESVKVEKNTMNEKCCSTANQPSFAINRPPRLTSMLKCNDAVRDKNRELFADALSKVFSEAQEEIREEVEACDPIRVAVTLESVMFEKLGRSSGAHKQKYRSILFNLKDNNNPDLRRRVLLGHIKPEVLINMTAEDMASDERKLQNKQIKEKALFECERANAPKASTDQFKCGRCGQRKCTYYQLQTRSADEPMTTFVTCVNCNNHWKFC